MDGQKITRAQAPEERQRERESLIRLIRAVFLVLFATVAFLTILDVEADPDSTRVGALALKRGWTLVVYFSAALVFGVVLIEVFAKKKRISTLTSIFLGLLIALLATYAMSQVIDLLGTVYDLTTPTGKRLIFIAKILVGITLAYLCTATIIQTQDDFRLVIPYVEFAKQIRGPRPLLLDSSALIDARIADLADTGIIQQPLVIPHFVVAELQLLADSADKQKRIRGRRGLDIIARLQRSATLDVSIDETPIPGMAVDQMLVELARRLNGFVVTADSGLNRVAGIQGVKTLNLNDVANSLKPALLPGEALAITLVKPGEHPGQGVGYLADGTMVVAEDGGDRVGERVTLTVTSSIQTSAGRMLFARLQAPESPDGAEPSTPEAESAPPTPGDRADEEARSDPPSASADGAAGMDPMRVDPPSAERARSPFPPKPPNKRINPARNPRR
ncbi:MAG: hypothetical protein KF678_08830 [Phycisphaeraceae bacterium]|nr:hypothetical protein [Phycisphaeraceae bacterium]